MSTALPHHNKDIFYLTDSGLETQLIFKDCFELREFAAFELLNDKKGWEYLKAYYRRHSAVAAKIGENSGDTRPVGFVFESATWRASPDWLKKLGYDNVDRSLQDICEKSMQLLSEVRDELPNPNYGILSGNIGPRSDGYVASLLMTVEEAKEYHKPQVLAFKNAGADIVSAFTLNYIDEGIGIAMAAREVGIPVVLSFTVETDGCLRTGESIQTIIESIDKATNESPAYYMINCAHPTHFLPVFSKLQALPPTKLPSWTARIGGFRGNASKLSHAELDEALELDDGSPIEFGNENFLAMKFCPQANVFGGCCGTDIRHVESIASACGLALQENKKRLPSL
jgi:S-methylmethionine-dependent homocysteine/selenocysteine methylase